MPRNSSIAPLILILVSIFLLGNVISYWIQVLLGISEVNTSNVVYTVMLVVGLILLGLMIGLSRISAKSYRFTDLLPVVSILYITSLVTAWEGTIVPGSSDFETWILWYGSLDWVFQNLPFWLILGLVVLGLARSGKQIPAKTRNMILVAVLLITSVLAFLCASIIEGSADAPEEVVDAVVMCGRVWSVLCWLRPLLLLKLFFDLGEDRIGFAGATITLFCMELGEVLILQVMVVMLDLGMIGYALTNGLAPLFGLLALKIAAYIHINLGYAHHVG